MDTDKNYGEMSDFEVSQCLRDEFWGGSEEQKQQEI